MNRCSGWMICRPVCCVAESKASATASGLQNLAARLRQVRPKQLLQQRRELLKVTQQRLRELARVRFKDLKNSLAAAESRLRLLGPEQVLARGYSITMDAASGKVLRDAAKVKAGQKLKTRLKTGEILSRAEG